MNTKKANPLKGVLVIPNVSEVPGFKISQEILKEFFITRLSAGRVTFTKEPSVKVVSFDFNGEDQDNWSGYIKGFLYPDKKFVGKAHYIPESKLKDETLNGVYKFIGKTLEVKGTWYDQEDSKYGFYFFLNETGEIPVIKKRGIKKKK